MNNRILMSIIAVMITILLAILLIWGASSCDAISNPVYIEGGENSELQNGENGESSEESSSVHGIEDSIFDELEEGELIDDFEGSDKPSQGSSGGNAPSSSVNSSAPEMNSGSSGNSSSRPSSRPSSGSSSSSPTISDAEEDGEMTYEEYMAMNGFEQEKYMKSFESIDAFFNWYNAAKDKYEAENPSIEIGDEPIDMNEIINGNNG